MHRHPPRVMITDSMLIQKYNEEILPSVVQSMISDLNIKKSKSTTMAASQESENPTNENTIEFVSPSNENTIQSVMTGKDATLLDNNREPRNNKRPSHDEGDTNEPDSKCSRNDDHASMIHTIPFDPWPQFNITISTK
jgi:hypothetical protein